MTKLGTCTMGANGRHITNSPVYAIPGAEGAATMQQLAQYSGNSSNDEISAILSEVQFDQSDYVRLYTSFGTTGSNNLPTLWAFLLIVLGIVLLLIGATSVSMHYFQRRHRRALQRRVENGEVDLESLGIKRSHPNTTRRDRKTTHIHLRSNQRHTQRSKSSTILGTLLRNSRKKPHFLFPILMHNLPRRFHPQSHRSPLPPLSPHLPPPMHRPASRLSKLPLPGLHGSSAPHQERTHNQRHGAS